MKSHLRLGLRLPPRYRPIVQYVPPPPSAWWGTYLIRCPKCPWFFAMAEQFSPVAMDLQYDNHHWTYHE
jgi:hypothetical protein